MNEKNSTRLYQVRDLDKDIDRIVEASNRAQVMRHCAAHRYTVRPATGKDIAALMAKGVKVEDANAERDPI